MIALVLVDLIKPAKTVGLISSISSAIRIAVAVVRRGKQDVFIDAALVALPSGGATSLDRLSQPRSLRRGDRDRPLGLPHPKRLLQPMLQCPLQCNSMRRTVALVLFPLRHPFVPAERWRFSAPTSAFLALETPLPQPYETF